VLREQVFNLVSRPLRPLHDAGIISEAPPDAPNANPASAPPKQPATAAPAWTALNPLEPFLVQLKLSAYAGIVLALPVVVYQICAFVFPGLTPRERNAARFLLIGSAFFVVAGVAVAYFGVFPLVLPYLMLWVPAGVSIQLRMSETIALIIKGLLGFAIAFQFPMVVLVLVYLDLLSPETLKKYRRIALVVLLFASGILTPPDPISMLVMWVPLALLYEVSIWMSYAMIKRRAASAA
jgi:sec-independent protein translocase protein TatC